MCNDSTIYTKMASTRVIEFVKINPVLAEAMVKGFDQT